MQNLAKSDSIRKINFRSVTAGSYCRLPGWGWVCALAQKRDSPKLGKSFTLQVEYDKIRFNFALIFSAKIIKLREASLLTSWQQNSSPSREQGDLDSSCPPALNIEAQKERVYRLILAEYQAYTQRRPTYIKAGLASILIIPMIFLVLMFSLESKIIFLVLWIISLIAIAAFLIYEEFKNYRYRNLLGLDLVKEAEDAANSGEVGNGQGPPESRGDNKDR